MGFFDLLRRVFGQKAQSEALQSASEAMQERFEALETPEIHEETQPIELQKDSLQLGIAAGYTGKSLRSIENSMVRIETQMPTKDWFELKFGESIKELANIFRQHEEKEQLRFEALQSTLESMKAIARTAPQPIRSKLFKDIRAAESQLPLSPRMKEVLRVVKESGEISYEDIAKRLNLGISGMRGMLSNMGKRTNDIERFEKDGKGWLRYAGKTDLKRSQSDGTALEPTVNSQI